MPRPPRRSPVRATRRGIALADALIGGVMLGVALAVVLTVASRSLAMQTSGEKHMVASWLADELLTMVLVEGPDNYPVRYDTSAHFDPPFDDYGYDVNIENLGRGAPYRVTATVRWSDRDQDFVRVQTLIALRLGDPEQLREPYERVDRDARNFPDETQ